MKATVTTVLQTLADVACAGEMKLLNDHLRITLPDGAEYFTPITEKTEPEASNHQVEIRIGQGNESIILEFAETYLADARFAERVKASIAQLNSEGNHFDIAQIGDNLVYAVMREETLAAKELMDGETTPFAFAEYRHPDGTVQQFGFRVGSRLVKDAQKCREQVIEWLKSVKPGETPLALQERVEHQESYMKGCRLAAAGRRSPSPNPAGERPSICISAFPPLIPRS